MGAQPVLAVTTGEPAGIGPDLAVMLAQMRFPARLVFLGDANVLEARAKQRGVSAEFEHYTRDASLAKARHELLPIAAARPVTAGKLDTENARYVLAMLTRALLGAQSGEFDAIVTAPVHKGIINDAGIAFTGHTEFFAQATATQRVVMMLVGGGMRVALATTHLPLKHVAAAITEQGIYRTIRIIERDMVERFGFHSPRILVAGLNPHAGEDGHLGREEIELIRPAIERAKSHAIRVDGPFPADTLFTPAMLKNADVVLAMYHDQGLPVLKHASFGEGVNVTLGLPVIRTSVDHGTALDRAGSGSIEIGSMKAAIDLAIDLATRHKTAKRAVA